MAKGRLSAEDRARVFKALADPRRIDIVDALATHGTMCGTELAERLDVSLALLCHHWDVLVDAGLVKKRREGQLRMCTLDQARLHEATRPFRAQGVPESGATRSQSSANTTGRTTATKQARAAKKAPATKKTPGAKSRAPVTKSRPSAARASRTQR